MNDLINCGNGDLQYIPEKDLLSPSKMRWWMNQDTSGDNPILENLAKIAWHRYSNTRPMTLTFKMRWKKRSRQFLFRHPYILAFAFKFKSIRKLVGA